MQIHKHPEKSPLSPPKPLLPRSHSCLRQEGTWVFGGGRRVEVEGEDLPVVDCLQKNW